MVTLSGAAGIALLLYTPLSRLSRKLFAFFRNFLGILLKEVSIVKFYKQFLRFCVGGLAYVGVELLWRGYSHISMFFAGGTCFLLLGKLMRMKPRLPLLLRGCMGALAITQVELLTGLLVNRQYAVWDYRDAPLNFFGQICLPFSLLWIPLSLVGMWLYDLLDTRLLKG